MANIHVDGVDRPMTKDEETALAAARKEMQADAKAAEKVAADKAAAAESARAKLAKLGLTDDEIAALVGA